MGYRELELKFTNNTGINAHGMKIKFSVPIEIMKINNIEQDDARFDFQIYFFDDERTTVLVKRFNLIPTPYVFSTRIKSKNQIKVDKASWRVGQFEDEYDDKDEDDKKYYYSYDLVKYPPDIF